MLPDEVTDVFYGSAWSADASHAVLPDRGRRVAAAPGLAAHGSAPRPTDDVLVFEEPDERFWVGVGLTRSEEYLVIDVHSKVTSEVVRDPGRPSRRAAPRLVAARRQGVEYERRARPGRQDRFLILHNDDAEDFALAWTPADATRRSGTS